MSRDFFIMMYHPSSTPMIMEAGEGEPAFFETEDAARRVAERNDFCLSFGYEIFEMGNGA